MTTIKVSRELRDRLKEQAAAEHRTLGEQIEYLVERGSRERRLERLRQEIAATPPELLASYREETAWWDTLENG